MIRIEQIGLQKISAIVSKLFKLWNFETLEVYS